MRPAIFAEGELAMAIGDLPLFGMLKTKMRWHQTRQELLADNVANADTPNFAPRELAPMAAPQASQGALAMAATKTHGAHFGAPAGGGGTASFAETEAESWETKRGGAAVVLEEQMMKVAENQFDYQLASTVYSRSLGLLRSAIGKQA
jgi:flagellar basal-body rod protein FlgB